MTVVNEIFNFLTSFNVVVFIAEAVLCFCLPKRKHFYLRLLVFVPYLLLLGFNYVSNALRVTTLLSLLYKVPYINIHYLLALAVSVLLLWFCFRADIFEVLFFGVTSFMVEHFCSHAMQLFTYALQGHHVTIPLESRIFEFALLCCVLVIMYFLLIRKYYENGIRLDNRSILFFVIMSMLAISVFSSVVFAVGLVSPVTHVYEMIVSFLLVVIQFEFFDRSNARRERKEIERVLREQAKQQAMFNDNINFINMKCHDLKHQIAALKDMQSPEERARNIEELERAVMLRDTLMQTGNDVLDVLLMEKQLLCQQKEIQLACFVDGEALLFMDSADMCALFGNAIGNAIEEVGKYEKEKRIISVVVRRESDLIHVFVENYSEVIPVFKNGLPVTTKGGEDEHGFGLKSIKYVVEKYGGNMTVTAEDSAFCVNILLPLK